MSRLKNVLIALDQLLNALANGAPDETLSSRAHRARAATCRAKCGPKCPMTARRPENSPENAPAKGIQNTGAIKTIAKK